MCSLSEVFRSLVAAESSPVQSKAMMSIPALLSAPGSIFAALGAIAEMPAKIEVLGTLLEQTNRNVGNAAVSVEQAARGIQDAAQGIERVVTMLDVSLPDLSDGAASLRELAEKLSEVAADLVVELPRTTTILGGIPSELAAVMDKLDSRIEHLESVIADVNQLVVSVVGFIPGMRKVVRPPRSTS